MKEKKLNMRVLNFLDKVGFTPLCEAGCCYEEECNEEMSKCKAHFNWDFCKFLTKITKKFQKAFPEVKEK